MFNYLSTIGKGLKNRHLTFGKDDEMLEMNLPADVAFEVKAQSKKGENSLKLEITWRDPVKPSGEKSGTKATSTSKSPKQDKDSVKKGENPSTTKAEAPESTGKVAARPSGNARKTVKSQAARQAKARKAKKSTAANKKKSAPTQKAKAGAPK
ncbi:MAG: amphi-Trp domain-containing protein [Pseudomonadales bacterium]|nr:amphi-Trp domain-containing protein [Pseudomonadales bacterium]